MRKIVLILLGLMALSIGTIVFLLQSPKTWAYLIHKGLNNRWEDVSARDVIIGAVKWKRFNHILLDNCSVRFKIKGATYYVSGDVELSNLKPIHVAGHNLAVVSDLVNISDGDLFFQDPVGQLQAKAIEVSKYLFNDVSLNFNVDQAKIVFSGIQSGFYGGALTGQGQLTFKPKLRYDFAVDLDKVDLSGLAQADDKVFGNMKGLATGNVAMKGSLNYIHGLKFNLAVPDGHISSKVLKALGEVLPKGNLFRQPLDAIVQKQDSIPFEQASISMESAGRGKYKASVNIYSPAASVDLRYTYDINLEGGLMNLLKSISVFI